MVFYILIAAAIILISVIFFYKPFDAEKGYGDLDREFTELSKAVRLKLVEVLSEVSKAMAKLDDDMAKIKQRADTAEFMAHSCKMEMVSRQKPQVIKVVLYRGQLKKKEAAETTLEKVKKQIKDLS